MKMGCKTIETATMEVFARHGWSFSYRIAPSTGLLVHL